MQSNGVLVLENYHHYGNVHANYLALLSVEIKVVYYVKCN